MYRKSFDKFRGLFKRIVFGSHLYKEVLSVKAGDKFVGDLKSKAGLDVLSHPRRCSGRKGNTYCTRETVSDRDELPVFRAKIVAPFRDTVGFINGEAIDRQCLYDLVTSRLNETIIS